MAADVHENVFSEEQLLRPDVQAEDEEQFTRRVAVVTPEPPKSTCHSEPPVHSRRKRASDRAKKILFLLESKYDVLTEVCAEYEDWKEATSAADFDLLWCDTAIPADRFMKLKTFQKMNHFVGMSSITRKNNLGRNLLRMRKQFPKEYRFFPDTWILPTDMSDFKQQFTNVKKQTFIIKPDNGCQGKGIFLIRDVEKVPVDFSSTFVAQRYISKPLLLDGYKFDLRLYVLVSGCDPLRIFLHRKGLVRLASEQYVEPTKNNLSEVMVHLTNYAINKANPNFEENTNPDDAEDGHKRSWEAVQEHLRKEGHDVDTLILEIEDLIVKTLIAVQPSLSHFYHSCQPEDVYNGMCFEILGFDVMLDQKLQPWLLEVNHAPSFATESELDHQVKHEVLQDSFNLLDLNPEVRRQKKREARERMEQRSLGKKPCIEDRIAQEREFALIRNDWEDAQLQNGCSGYKRLYPSPEKEKAYWQVHDAAINIWEMMMGGTFRRAVRLSDPLEKPPVDESRVVEKAARANSAAKAAMAGEETKVEAKRTAEEIREVVERLAQGCSARPRKNTRKRGKEEEKDEAPGTSEVPGPAEQRRSHSNRYIDVQVGDLIRVQTNLGWETVTVRAKRPGTGKIDIQFKDGEYMRAVMPRILRNAEGLPVKETHELPTTALPPPWPSRSSQVGPHTAPPMAPVPVSSSGAVPQKLAGYKGGLASSPGRQGHPGLAEEPSPRETQDALAGAIMEGCGVELREQQNGLSTATGRPAGRLAPAAKAPAARLKQQLQQLISARPIVVPKVQTRSPSMPRNAPVPEPVLGHGLVGSAMKADSKIRIRSSES
ncbi:Probable beta-tubulin polyglutamylase (Tubulin-tyrosine ligase family protein 6A) [Durusdinium trenchii]